MSERTMRIVFSSGISNLVEKNSSFDSGVLRVAYTGKNRNNSFISKETYECCIQSIYNCPIVCNYDRETDTIGSHDIELVSTDDGGMKIVNITQPVGVIPESAKYWWEEIEDNSGVHEYLCVDALIWKRQEAYRKIKDDGITDESMEISIKEGEMVDGMYVIKRFEFTAFCLLGTAEPCFESASLEMFSCDGFKQQLAEMMQEFKGRHQELVSALVERVDPKTGALSLKIGKAEAILPKGEQVGTENVKEGDHVQVYVVDVKETEKGPKAIISRTHPDLIRRLFEKEVPEIFDGTVEIKAVAREAGSRTKIAVMSHNPDVDAVGACIGTRGTRVSDIVNELGGEKMDIVDYSEDPAKFIAAALAPATVLSVETAEDGSHVCKVTVPDSQLSLAIGNKGQNARLAAKLTGWKIDIKPESGFFGEEEEA